MKPTFASDGTRKRLSNLNGLRAAVFGSAFLIFCALTVGGGLMGNAIAFSIPYLFTSLALSGYFTRDLFGIGPVDALFSSDSEIRKKRANR